MLSRLKISAPVCFWRYSLPVGLDGGFAEVPPSVPEEDWLAPLLVPVVDEPEGELPVPLALPPPNESLLDGDGLSLRPADEPEELPIPELLLDGELEVPMSLAEELAPPTPNALAVLSSMRPVACRLFDF